MKGALQFKGIKEVKQAQTYLRKRLEGFERTAHSS